PDATGAASGPPWKRHRVRSRGSLRDGPERTPSVPDLRASLPGCTKSVLARIVRRPLRTYISPRTRTPNDTQGQRGQALIRPKQWAIRASPLRTPTNGDRNV